MAAKSTYCNSHRPYHPHTILSTTPPVGATPVATFLATPAALDYLLQCYKKDCQRGHGLLVVRNGPLRLGNVMLEEGIAGIIRRHELIAEPEQVVVGIETDRGPWVQALLAAGYQVYAINPCGSPATASGAASRVPRAMPLTRTPCRHGTYRPASATADAGYSDLAEAIKVVARARKTLIWERTCQVPQLRHTLPSCSPAALEAFAELTAAEAWSYWAGRPIPSRRPG